eukprot:g225.t1
MEESSFSSSSGSEDDENEQNDLLLLTLGEDEEKEEKEGTRVAFTPLQSISGSERYFARRTSAQSTTRKDISSVTHNRGENLSESHDSVRRCVPGPNISSETHDREDIVSEPQARGRLRIPGPAGARSLHASIAEDTALGTLDGDGVDSDEKKEEEEENPFTKGAWLTLCRKIGRSPGGSAAADKVRTIDRVLSEKFYTKVPDIAVVVSSIVRTSSYCGEATLVDPTGTICAIVHRDALERWKRDEFVAGAALHLKNVTVFTVRIGEHALVITERNVAALVPPTASIPSSDSPHTTTRADDDASRSDRDRPLRGSSRPPFGLSFQRSILSSLSTSATSPSQKSSNEHRGGEDIVQDIFGESLATPSPPSPDCGRKITGEKKTSGVSEDVDDSFEVVDEDDVAALAAASWGTAERSVVLEANTTCRDADEMEEEEESDVASEVETGSGGGGGEEADGDDDDDDDENSDSDLLMLNAAWG